MKLYSTNAATDAAQRFSCSAAMGTWPNTASNSGVRRQVADDLRRQQRDPQVTHVAKALLERDPGRPRWWTRGLRASGHSGPGEQQPPPSRSPDPIALLGLFDAHTPRRLRWPRRGVGPVDFDHAERVGVTEPSPSPTTWSTPAGPSQPPSGTNGSTPRWRCNPTHAGDLTDQSGAELEQMAGHPPRGRRRQTARLLPAG